MQSNKMPDVMCCQFVAEGLADVGYQAGDAEHGRTATWRLSSAPLALSRADVEWLHALGRHLHNFNRALEKLYMDSATGRQPNWIAGYLDQGKPGSLVRYARLRQIGRSFPTIIRPDIIPTSEGWCVSELDAVPGGPGIIARLSELYSDLGYEVIGNDVTVPGAFAAMVRMVSGNAAPNLAIVVSDESAAYRPEMAWLAQRLGDYGIQARAVTPEELTYLDDRVVVKSASGDFDVGVVYRFFELFDLPNIPEADQLMHLNARNRVSVVPPFRPFFEEKLNMALFHHPVLAPYWQTALGPDGYAVLKQCFPPTWILDPTPIPPDATIAGLIAGGAPVNSWASLENLGRRQRQFVIKPSGFSEFAWGSRGVVVGHDISTPEWNEVLQQALDRYVQTPHVLQEFRAGRHFEGKFYDAVSGSMLTIQCRVRLSPYFFVIGEEVKLAAVMATMCPLDKKKIHGMPQAIITPCTLDRTGVEQ